MVFRIRRLSSGYNYRQTPRIMMLVCLAAIPGTVAQIYFFGWGTLLQLFLGCISAITIESIVLKIRKMSVIYVLNDNSALLTGWLLAISIPPLTPWWITVLGSFFSITIAKQIYGGLGNNIFNPAMVGYAVLLISFPTQMKNWLPEYKTTITALDFSSTLQIIFTNSITISNMLSLQRIPVDGVSQATPLDTLKMSLRENYRTEQIAQRPICLDTLTNMAWKWINLAYLLGGLFLLKERVIRWHIPVSFLVSLILLFGLDCIFLQRFMTELKIHLFSGATMLGAFFILTDPVTSAITSYGCLIFGSLAGFFLWLIREFGNYPDGVAFAVLLANVFVPLINYYTCPKAYGHK